MLYPHNIWFTIRRVLLVGQGQLHNFLRCSRSVPGLVGVGNLDWDRTLVRLEAGRCAGVHIDWIDRGLGVLVDSYLLVRRRWRDRLACACSSSLDRLGGCYRHCCLPDRMDWVVVAQVRKVIGLEAMCWDSSSVPGMCSYSSGIASLRVRCIPDRQQWQSLLLQFRPLLDYPF